MSVIIQIYTIHYKRLTEISGYSRAFSVKTSHEKLTKNIINSERFHLERSLQYKS